MDHRAWRRTPGGAAALIVMAVIFLLLTEEDPDQVERSRAGRKAESTHRLSGRARDQRLVHFSVPDGAEWPRPGDLVLTVGAGDVTAQGGAILSALEARAERP